MFYKINDFKKYFFKINEITLCVLQGSLSYFGKQCWKFIYLTFDSQLILF